MQGCKGCLPSLPHPAGAARKGAGDGGEGGVQSTGAARPDQEATLRFRGQTGKQQGH